MKINKKTIGFLLPIIIICSDLLFNVGVIFAQTQTPEPTSTPVPAYIPDVLDPEDLPDIGSDFTCPSGGVSGVGECEPASLWLLKCGHCLDNLAPVPTAVGTPSPTPDPAWEDSYMLFHETLSKWLLGGSGSPVTEPEPETIYSYESTEDPQDEYMWVWNDSLPDSYTTTVYYDFKLDVEGYGYYGSNRVVRLYVKNTGLVDDQYGYGNGYAEINVYDNSTGTLSESWELDYSEQEYIDLWYAEGSIPIEIDEQLAFEVIAYGYNQASLADIQIVVQRLQFFGDPDWEEIASMHYENNVYYYSEEEEEEENYCSSVVCEGDTGYEEYGFGYDGITYGAITCFDIGPVNWTVLGVGFTIPWIAHLCLQQIGMGDLNALGVNIDLNIILLTMSVAWAFYYIFVT